MKILGVVKEYLGPAGLSRGPAGGLDAPRAVAPRARSGRLNRGPVLALREQKPGALAQKKEPPKGGSNKGGAPGLTSPAIPVEAVIRLLATHSRLTRLSQHALIPGQPSGHSNIARLTVHSDL